MEHTNILDEENKGSARLYCDKSLRFLSYSLIFLMIGLLIIMITNYFNVLMSLSLTLTGVPVIAVLMAAGLGLWYSMQSIRFREDKPLKQSLGLCGNFLVLTMIFLIFFALIPSKAEQSISSEEVFEAPQEILDDLPWGDTIQ